MPTENDTGDAPTTPEPVALTRGGELAITPVDDDAYVLRVGLPGGSFNVHLTNLDVQAIRTLTGDLTLAHLRAVEDADREFMRLIEQETGS
jgi:hypothetical protein